MRAIEVLTREKILETVIYRMVDRDSNADLLNNVPHIRILDLAAAYYCILSQEDGYHAGVFINDETLRHFGIREEELDAAARRNTAAAGFLVQRVSKILGIQEEGFPEFMYVLTNSEAMYGASVILYPDYLRKLAEEMGTDLYILPSSIHEVIAVTVSGMEPTMLQDIVKEINGTNGVISPYEVLSNNVYRYSLGSGLVCAGLDATKK